MRSRTTLDEDLAAMYLTDKRNGTPRRLSDHEELEVLLESFSKQVEEIVNEAENIQVSRDASFRHRRAWDAHKSLSSTEQRAVDSRNRRTSIRF